MKKKVTYNITIMKEIYSIQGIIFQEGSVFGLGHKPGIGTAVTIQKAMLYSMFHAVVGPSDDGKTLCGHMNDQWGDSEITNFKISEEEMSFTKKYANRPPINYLFQPSSNKNSVWLGKYIGFDCGKGVAKCIVVPIDENFFEPTIF